MYIDKIIGTLFRKKLLSQSAIANSSSNILRILGITASCGSIAYGLHVANKKHTKIPVIDKSIMRASQNIPDLCVIGADTLMPAGSQINAGRSAGCKLKRKHPVTSKMEYLYFKATFTRADLIHELIVGSLGRELFGDKFPMVYVYEKPFHDLKDNSQYGFLSASLGKSVPHSDLEAWANHYNNSYQAEQYGPRQLLGVSIAFDMLMGKSDCKLANLVCEWDSVGNCYSIDHESAFQRDPQFILDTRQLLECIGEYTPKSAIDYLHEDNCFTLDTNNDIDKPLKGNAKVKTAIYPFLLRAIEHDVDNKSIFLLYERFCTLSAKKLENMVSQSGLLTPAECQFYVKELRERQEATRKFIEQFVKPNDLLNTTIQTRGNSC